MNDKKYSKNLLIVTIIISVVVGSFAGGVTGFLAGTFFSVDIGNILSNFGWDNNQNSSLFGIRERSGDKLSVEQIVVNATPAVVSIVATKEVTQYNQTGSIFPFEDWFNFNSPFGWQLPQYQVPQQGPQTEIQQIGAGTGFIISSDGLVLTNKHVVDDQAATYTVTLSDDTSYEAEVLGRDPFNDLAILKIAASDLPILSLGDSESINIGESVVAIGFALGEYSNTVTTGIVSGLSRDVVAGNGLSSEKLEGVIQTDTAINPGNSGGPLINMYGEVIGINTAVNREGQLIGFAIPINGAKQMVNGVKEFGRIVRPYMGVRYVMINEAMAIENKLAVDYGALVARGQNMTELAVIPGSPADKAGIVENDIILEIEGVKLENDNTLAKLIANYQPGDKIEVKLYHRGEYQDVNVVLEEYQE
ncbi:MAG: hypothetical protein AUJ28_02490 [Parcubacteria group bacterium CG1_02_37_51]|uniref:PDZ domain-containing protein n=2 Tax=Candidatus Komeiliibacteriota TaxID=1817908 RepID=A0A2M8DQD1_9BACT|nr:MAG: hypothetical protein AUJ28_02490 [Parcubacteria group bacterium CG1_02_37_51]PIY94243.1 MAG: hypothetical protein COY67_02815 [Candidatus Komeilibacteria bacterium CG_4_10_14_0_8_um_filter_37_78]PJC01206.1 MAG: hypothetical protein CO073_04040 [Candidatus Komeilibacteria bacterium CG_4_9_14_0_8_um_filter_36_9]